MEADPIDAAITSARAFGAQEHAIVATGVDLLDRIDRGVAVTETVGRLVLSNGSNRDLVIAWLNHTDDMHLSHLMIWRPEHAHISMRASYIRRRVPVDDLNCNVGAVS